MPITLEKPPVAGLTPEIQDFMHKVYLKLQEKKGNEGITYLGGSDGVDMKTAGSTTIFTTDAELKTFVAFVLVRSPSASLAGGTDYDFTNWKQTVDLSSLTTADTDYVMIDGNNAKYTALPVSTDFQITVNTGSTAAATATIEVFGFTGG